MAENLELLDDAIDCVKREQRDLREEAEAFKLFRKTVGHTPPGESKNAPAKMEEVLQAYRNQVFDSLNYGDTYNESWQESLKAELTPKLGEIMINNQPLTQRRKRDLLVAINETVEQRTSLIKRLERERDSLRTIRDALLDIEETLQGLPPYSLQHLEVEVAIDIWETCEKLINRCDQIAEARQRRFKKRHAPLEPVGTKHTLNEFLYKNLETQFPALVAITNTRRRIEQYRGKPVQQGRVRPP